MVQESPTIQVNLTRGYTDEKGQVHQLVVIGKRLTGAALMAASESPEAALSTQHELLILRAGITQFGTLPIPPPLKAFLPLGETEIDDLVEAHNRFLAESLDGKLPEFLSESELKLAIGYDLNGLIYNRVRFSKWITGFDMVEADRKGLLGLRRELFFIGRQIDRLSSEDGNAELPGPIGLDVFARLDGVDIVAMRGAAIRWRESFRIGGVKVSGNGNGKDSGSPNATPPAAGASDSLVATGKT